MDHNETLSKAEAEAALDGAISRLMAIRWNSHDDYKTSYRMLVHEYLRRLAFWYKALGKDKIGASFKGLDLPSSLLPLPHFAQEKINSMWEPYVEKRERERPLKALQYRLCEQYLHWTAIQATPEVTQYGLVSPYEPLIMLYERGSDFLHGNTGIELPSMVIYRALSPEDYLHAKAIDLDAEALDALDVEQENEAY